MENDKRLVLRVGTLLFGFCGGDFGRDSYLPKRVEALGADWVVVRDSDGVVDFAAGKDILEKLTEYTTDVERERWA